MITHINLCCMKSLFIDQCKTQCINLSYVNIKVFNLIYLNIACSISYFINDHFNSLVSPSINFRESYTGNIPVNANNIRVTIFNYDKVPPCIICVKNYITAQNTNIGIQGTPNAPVCVELSPYSCNLIL